MKLTNNFELPCAEEDDTGALALYLQNAALDIDAQLKAQKDAFDLFQRPPTIVYLSTLGSTQDYNTEQTVTGLFSGTPVINTWTSATASLIPPVPGWWQVGVSLVTVATAAVSDNSAVHLHLEVYTTDISPGVDTLLYRFSETSYESNTNGEHFNLTGVAYVPPNTTCRVRTKMFHLNVNGRTVLTGARSWYTWLGTGEISNRVEF